MDCGAGGWAVHARGPHKVVERLAQMVINLTSKDITIKNIYGDEFIQKYGHKCPIGVKGRNSDNKLYKEKIGWSVNQPLLNGLKLTYDWINSISKG